MADLQKARMIINEVDEKIARNFEERMKAVEEVIAYKIEHHLPIFDSKREEEVIQRNLDKITDENLKPYYKDLLIQIMRISKEYQKDILNKKGE